VIDIDQKMAQSPEKSIPQLFNNTYAIKATYQLFKHERSTPDLLQEGHRNLVFEQLKNGTYLLIEDTSEFSWSGNLPVQGLGPISASTKGLQGFFLHSVIATRWLDSQPNNHQSSLDIIGLIDQLYNVREENRQKLKRKTAGAGTEKLESRVWERTLKRIPLIPQENHIRLVRVCDRIIESEIDMSLFKYARFLASQGTYSLKLRSRPNIKERIATLSVTYGPVRLKSSQRPGYKRGASMQSIVQSFGFLSPILRR